MGAVDNARVEAVGSVRGADERGHDVFKLERDGDPTLYGDYFYVFPDEKGNDFDIEVGVFGYRDPFHVGEGDPAYREHLSPEDAVAAEHLIRSYFLSNPPIYAEAWGLPVDPPVKFLGGVRFRLGWIIQKS